MNWFQKLKEQDAWLDEKINLSKRYPGYFSKWIFRAMLIPIVLVIVFAGNSLNWSFEPQVYVECNKDVPCRNPLYDEARAYGFDSANGLLAVPIYAKPLLFPGETYGEPPSFFVRNGSVLILFFVVAAFALNHLAYKVKQRW